MGVAGRLLNPLGEPISSKTADKVINPEEAPKNKEKKTAKRSIVVEKKLSFYNTHTGESIKNVVFWAGNYIGENLTLINKLFRDHRTGDIAKIDLKLLHLLHLLHHKLDVAAPFHLISGFRSRATNAMLHERSDGVARQSQHTLGKAADIALPGVRSLRDIRRAAKMLGLGGVGYYSQFVHVDVGRVRYW